MERGMEETGVFGTERGRRPSGVPNTPDAPAEPAGALPAGALPVGAEAAASAQPGEVPEAPARVGAAGPSGSEEQGSGAAEAREVDGVAVVDVTALEAGSVWPEARPPAAEAPRVPPLGGTRRGRRLAKPEAAPLPEPRLTPEQRLLLLDTWRRSALPGGDFGALVGVSPKTLYGWKRRFER